ncbi:uncharacterized protein LOC117172746 isoform X2 [Belonocnema kinseyi]|uniref:uncharacterized protein LOC117172746 isoform X2 n=1 Tax=Belonocnema kinseyi TaxID=2817044 RepID=UPI00143D4C38|nr:uncharacterized protein LOC117172746 isoform X2 [Belonocnema kinseyi]
MSVQQFSELASQHLVVRSLRKTCSVDYKPRLSAKDKIMDAVENEYSDIFYIVNPTNGQLEEAGPSGLQIERLETIDEVTEAGPSKKAKKDMSAFEETFFKEFKAEIRKEKKLLQEEHEMRMKLWGLEMENSQQEHTLKMEILKEKLEMVRQEKETLQRERTAKYLGKFRSGPI